MIRRLNSPAAVTGALVLSIINGVGGVIFTAAWPGIEDRGTVLPVSIVIGALLIAAAWLLSTGNRWGAIATLILNGLNVLLAIPGYFDANVGFMIGGTITIVLSVLTIGLVLSSEARAYWMRGVPGDRKLAPGD